MVEKAAGLRMYGLTGSWEALGGAASAFETAAKLLYKTGVHRRENPHWLIPPTKESGELALTAGCTAAFAVELYLKTAIGEGGGSRKVFRRKYWDPVKGSPEHNLAKLWAYAKTISPEGMKWVAEAWLDREGETRAWDLMKSVEGLVKEHSEEFKLGRYFGEDPDEVRQAPGGVEVTARRAAESEGLLVLCQVLREYISHQYGLPEIDGPYDWPEINLKKGQVAHRGIRRLYGWDTTEVDKAIKQARKRKNVEQSLVEVRQRVDKTFWEMKEEWETQEEAEKAFSKAGGMWQIRVVKAKRECGNEENTWETKDAWTAERAAERAVKECGVRREKGEPGGSHLRMTQVERGSQEHAPRGHP